MSQRTVTVDGVTLSEDQVRQAMAQLAKTDVSQGVRLIKGDGGFVYVSMPVDGVRDALDEADEETDTHLFVCLNAVYDGVCAWYLDDDDRLATFDEAIAALKEGMGK